MDNITHSLVGAVFAEMAMPERAPRAMRGLFFAAGVLAANAPDLDLIYVGITEFPLGYLLHHRGHTHTVVGLVAQAVVLGIAAIALMRAFLPAAERGVAWRARLLALIAVALASHVALDACNSYGVHPFAPFDARWYFGDTLFIFEPWLWVMLALPAAMNARRRLTRMLVAAPMTVLIAAVAITTAIDVTALVLLLSAGAAFAWAARGWTPRIRAAAAAGFGVVFVAGMFLLSNVAEAATRTLLAGETRGQIVDVVLTPNPASPACWSVIAIELDDRKDARQEDREGDRESGLEPSYVLRRGTLSLWPAVRRPETCASHRLMDPRDIGRAGDGRIVWSDEIRQPLAHLRTLAGRDCWVAAWLQFGRAPVFADGRVYDLRFTSAVGGNFSAMTLRSPGAADGAASCPANLTHWGMPRADLLQPADVTRR